MSNEKYFVLDLESDGLNAWLGNRITAIGIRTSEGQEQIFLHQNEEETLQDFRNWFLEQHQDFQFMITKNGKLFDIPFICARMNLVLPTHYISFIRDLLAYQHTDLQEITDKWVSLDNMAKILCLPVKTGNGLQAIKLWKEGKLEELKSYLKHDLWLTEQVFLRRKMLEEWNRKEEIQS